MMHRSAIGNVALCHRGWQCRRGQLLKSDSQSQCILVEHSGWNSSRAAMSENCRRRFWGSRWHLLCGLTAFVALWTIFKAGVPRYLIGPRAVDKFDLQSLPLQAGVRWFGICLLPSNSCLVLSSAYGPFFSRIGCLLVMLRPTCFYDFVPIVWSNIYIYNYNYTFFFLAGASDRAHCSAQWGSPAALSLRQHALLTCSRIILLRNCVLFKCLHSILSSGCMQFATLQPATSNSGSPCSHSFVFLCVFVRRLIRMACYHSIGLLTGET